MQTKTVWVKYGDHKAVGHYQDGFAHGVCKICYCWNSAHGEIKDGSVLFKVCPGDTIISEGFKYTLEKVNANKK